MAQLVYHTTLALTLRAASLVLPHRQVRFSWRTPAAALDAASLRARRDVLCVCRPRPGMPAADLGWQMKV